MNEHTNWRRCEHGLYIGRCPKCWSWVGEISWGIAIFMLTLAMAGGFVALANMARAMGWLP